MSPVSSYPVNQHDRILKKLGRTKSILNNLPAMNQEISLCSYFHQCVKYSSSRKA